MGMLFRNTNDRDDENITAGRGIESKDPSADVSASRHIGHTLEKTQWISMSRSLAAELKGSLNGEPCRMVLIDEDRLPHGAGERHGPHRHGIF